MKKGIGKIIFGFLFLIIAIIIYIYVWSSSIINASLGIEFFIPLIISIFLFIWGIINLVKKK